MEIPQTLYNDISAYCKANTITDVDGFVVKLLTRAFTVEKYGFAPTLSITSVERAKADETLQIITPSDISSVSPSNEIPITTKEKTGKDLYDE